MKNSKSGIGKTARFCPECGFKLENGTMFCPNCGTKIDLPQVTKKMSSFSNVERTTKGKTTCPYCGEEILEAAKKCKHCGEWLENFNKDNDCENTRKEVEGLETTNDSVNEDNKSSVGLRILGRILGTATIFLIAFLLFKYGGWQMAWGKTKAETISWTVSELGQFNIPLTDAKNFIFTAHGILIRVNNNFYGAMSGTQYFDSPFIQWIMLFFAFGAFVEGFVFLLTGDFTFD